MKITFKKLQPYIYNLVILLLFAVILSIPFFSELNNLFLDRLQGDIDVRDEIVIIGIDDATLAKIGAWPWDREVFATALDQMKEAQPRVVTFDVLFLESREGDEAFQQSIDDVGYNVVMGSKLVEGEYLPSIFAGENVTYGYTNFKLDNDSKVRRATISADVEDRCVYSLAFSTINSYLGLPQPAACEEQVQLSSDRVYDRELLFNSTDSEFTYYSFNDLYEGKIPEAELKGKIVMIGATPIDLKSNLLDNFTDIFGRTTPGIIIHANIVNSFLQDEFRQELNVGIFIVIIVAVSLGLMVIYGTLKNYLWEMILFIGALIAINVIGIIFHVQGINWYFLQGNILIAVSYVFYVAFKFFVVSKEKRYLKDAFGKYINPKLLNELIEDPSKLHLGGEKKVITVMFSDIVGYTTAAEKMNPTELLNFTNNYFDKETNIIIEHDGTIDKYLGDGIMAFWNAPVSDPEHQKHALRAAINMRKALKAFNAEYPNVPDIDAGIGINTADMIVGNMGSKKRYSYTLIGDGVNLAARIEGLTRFYKVPIIVSEYALKDLDISQENFIVRLLDEVMVKGKKQPVKIFEIFEKNDANKTLKEKYEVAFEKYQKGEFDEAERLFGELAEDNASKLMLERLPEVRQIDNWEGVWEWKAK